MLTTYDDDSNDDEQFPDYWTLTVVEKRYVAVDLIAVGGHPY